MEKTAMGDTVDSDLHNMLGGLTPRVFDMVGLRENGRLKLMRNIEWQHDKDGRTAYIEYGAYVFKLNELTPESVARAREIAATLDAGQRVNFFWDEGRKDPENHLMVMMRDLEK